MITEMAIKKKTSLKARQGVSKMSEEGKVLAV